MKPIREDVLLSQARCFDLEALDTIYETYSPRLYAYALRLLGDPNQAEDCVAETFDRFLHALKAGGGPQQYLQAYLYRVAHNWITDRYRSAVPMVAIDDQELLQMPADSGNEAGDCIARQQMQVALRQLTPEQRQVIMLKYVEGWENESIAQALGKPIGAIKSLQHRALDSLRRILVAVEKSVDSYDES